MKANRTRIISALVVIFLIIIGFIYTSSTGVTPHEEFHVHAAFQQFIGDERQSYANEQFMHVEPCTLDDHHNDSAKTPDEKAHLHDLNGEVVHVHDETATWNDFFTGLGVTLPENAIGYINGVEDNNFLDAPIENYDRLLIVDENTTDIDGKIYNLPSVEDIRSVENASESCGN
ncbi:hypothetical protein KC571_02745 [candidate division WWE3 bacterium]|uniref:Uncharacterized protein n=1 Tax=candidate division WWE3 bacterium TaxID=2053526 RepID=A0A955LH41_UNCKA|nr:hypothetical protein [candidate division WWE3 bacterium]